MRPQMNLPPVSTRTLRSRFSDTSPLLWELMKGRIGILALGLVLVMISRVAGLALPSSMMFLVDTIIGKRQTQWLLPLMAGIFAATLVQGATAYALTQLLAKEGLNVVRDLRCRLQAHVNRLPVAFHNANKSGALASRIIADVDGARNLLSIGIVQFLGSIITALYALAYLSSINVALTFTALASMAVYSAIAKKQMKKRKSIFTDTMTARQDVQGRLIESLSGIRVIKAYHAEEHEKQVFTNAFGKIVAAGNRMFRLTSLTNLASGLVLGLGTLVITYLATYEIIAGRLTVGGFMTFNAFVMFLMGPALQFGGLTQQVGDALTGIERSQELLQEKTEDDNPKRQVRMEEIQGAVRVEGVSFSYDLNKRVLHDISFEAAPGTVTALVGPSGSGKSTIISLIAAFYEPSEGTIRVDNIDLSTVRLDSYRSRLGVVFQDTFLFDGTIRENVAFARPSATESEILEACRVAHVHEFVEKMPAGYDTLVGERGVRLSGGQQQRISIARAVLASPQILILDEATSSLDSESEAAIQEAMAYLLQGRTTFVIAHRLSTIHRANQILLVEGGRITERGTHQSLYDARGRYYDLYTRQQSLHGDNLFLPHGETPEAPVRTLARPAAIKSATAPASVGKG